MYLYAVGTGGYGGKGIAATSSNASTSLLNSNVLTQVPAGGKDGSNNYYATTGSGGNFSISGDYTCPSASTQVYLFAKGGNSGAGDKRRDRDAGRAGIVRLVEFVDIRHRQRSFDHRDGLCARGLCDGRDAYFQFRQHAGASRDGQRFCGDSKHGDAEHWRGAGDDAGRERDVWQKGINALANILASCVNTALLQWAGYPCTRVARGRNSIGVAAPPETASGSIDIAHYPAGGNASRRFWRFSPRIRPSSLLRPR